MSHKKITKNTILLSVRSLVTAVLGLYTYSIIVNQLGLTEFGVYTAIFGLISILNIFSSSMISTSNRFMMIEFIKNNNKENRGTFTKLFVINTFFGFFLILLSLTIGIYFINNILDISSITQETGVKVLLLIALSLFIFTISIPFNSILIAGEHFSFKAKLEVFQSILNLFAAYVLTSVPSEKIVAYSILTLFVNLFIFLILLFFCLKYYGSAIKLAFNFKLQEYGEIIKYCGWNFIYTASSIISIQGSVLIVNHYFGSILNASQSISSKIFDSIYIVVRNVNIAAQPQITKTFADNQLESSTEILCKIAKYSFFIMIIPGTLLFVIIDSFLEIWLVNIPPYVFLFLMLRFVQGLITSLESGMDSIIDACGNIKRSRLTYSVLFNLSIFLNIVLFHFGFAAFSLFIVNIFVQFIYLIFQLVNLNKLFSFNVSFYINSVLRPALYVLISLVPLSILRNFVSVDISNILMCSFVAIIYIFVCIYIFGLDTKEKVFLKSFFHIFLSKFRVNS